MERRIGDANIVGHLVLLLVAGACAFLFRGIPVLIWLIVYILSALIATSAWGELESWAPLHWLSGALLGGVLTYVLYLFGMHFLHQPELVFKLWLMLVPISLLVCTAGLARSIYTHFERRQPRS